MQTAGASRGGGRGPRDAFSPHVLARYPFLPEAAEHAARDGPALEDLLHERVYANARSMGKARVRAALEDASLPTPTLSAASQPRELLEELLSYVHARILVSALDDSYMVRRHALAEAVRVRDYLAKEESPEIVVAAGAVVELPLQPEGDGFRMHFTDFLRYSVHLKDMEWKLVRQKLKAGFVHLDQEQAARLIQEGLRRRIEGELPKRLSEEIEKAVEPDLAPLREAMARKKASLPIANYGKVELGQIPPCMNAILGELQRGVNAAHNARFALVTFLHKIGMSSEEIMTLFAQAPDFREDLTRYQVEHITGVSSGTTYSVPGCDNLRTFNLCHPDALCASRTKAGKARVAFPGDYYRYKSEGSAVLAKIEAAIPIAARDAFVGEMAMDYWLLKRLDEIAAAPAFAKLQAPALVELAPKFGIAVEGEPKVLRVQRPRALVDLLMDAMARTT